MHCVKTGARVYIYELSALVAADIYAVGEEALVVRWNERSLKYCSHEEAMDLGATNFVGIGGTPNSDWCWEDLGVMVTQRKLVLGGLCE